MLNDYISVSELNLYIKTYLENNYFLQDVYVKGEISNFKRHQSGTLYFVIKDEKAAINVVMFQSYANKLKVSLKDGDLVLIKGRISVYEARGTYSINASEVIFDSKGMLLIQFEQLKERLYNEGLFDQQYKAIFFLNLFHLIVLKHSFLGLHIRKLFHYDLMSMFYQHYQF